MQVPANLTDFAEEVQVQDEFLILAGAQVIKQLVHHEKQAVVWKRWWKAVIISSKACLLPETWSMVGEAVAHADRRQVSSNSATRMSRRDMVVAPISVRTTLNRPLIFPAASRHGSVVESGGEIGILRKRGNYRHEVGLPGAVVADHQKAFVIGGLLEL